MKPFFVYSHLGANISFWNELLSSHRRIMSIYESKTENVYVNGDLTERKPEPKKWFFSKAKWFDILLHNKQVGFKNFYSAYPSVVIYSFDKNVESNIKTQKLYEKNHIENYLSMRYQRLNCICKWAIQPLVFVEGLTSVATMQESLSRFLNLKNECEEVAENNFPNDFQGHKNFLYLTQLHEAGKIVLAV